MISLITTGDSTTSSINCNAQCTMGALRDDIFLQVKHRPIKNPFAQLQKLQKLDKLAAKNSRKLTQ
jgi:hypothetical protein